MGEFRQKVSPTNPVPHKNTIIFEPPAADEPVNLISMEAANKLAVSHVLRALTTLHDHFDTNQRYSGDYIRRQIRTLRDDYR